MKLLCGAIVLVCAPLAIVANEAAYPSEKVAEFVVDKLDVTTFPSMLRPKHEKGKKTLGDYGYVTRTVDEKEAVVEAPQANRQITIKILEQSPSGLYVCAESRMPNASKGQFRRVLRLTRKDASGLLKSRESWKEFDGCPVTGGDDNDSASGGY